MGFIADFWIRAIYLTTRTIILLLRFVEYGDKPMCGYKDHR